MKIMIIGGTRFLGKYLIEAAQRRGHQVTMFNRGVSNPDWFPDVEKLHGDRANELSALSGRTWDAAIDTCGYVPRIVRLSCQALADQVEHYTFISSISVYANPGQIGLDETAPVATLVDPLTETVDGNTYGGLKALCELAAETLIPGRVLVVRPGLIVGPYDLSDRFTYWPVRVARGGEILAPDSPDWQTQVIDVRDLAEWNVRLVEQRITGIFNAVGPAERLTFGQILETSRSVSGSQAEFTWVRPEFLLERGLQPWSDLPLWLPGEEDAGMDQVSLAKALASGLSFRPLAETIQDTLTWAAGRPAEHTWRAGLSAEKEIEVLKAWHASTFS